MDENTQAKFDAKLKEKKVIYTAMPYCARQCLLY